MQNTSFPIELSPQIPTPDGNNSREILKPQSLPTTTADKQTAWEAKRREINHIVDGLGLGIDEGIKETVVAFNILGIHTTGSCEGHLDHGLLTPSVGFAVPGRPETQFIGEMQVFQEFADQSGIPLEEFRRGEDWDGYLRAVYKSSGNGETDEFKAWAQQSDEMARRVQGLLDEFYENHEAAPNLHLRMHRSLDAGWTVYAMSEEEHKREISVPETERPLLLLARQGEMRAFTEFLRGKYFFDTNKTTSYVSNTPKSPTL